MGEISVPVQRPPSQATYDACAIGTEAAVPQWMYYGQTMYRQTGMHANPKRQPPLQLPTADGKYMVCVTVQAKKLRAGQRFTQSYGSRYGFRQIPYDLRNRYDLDPRDRYYYGNGYLYQVDPRTLLVQQVISALLR